MNTYDRRNSTSITFRLKPEFKERMNRVLPKHWNTRSEFLLRTIEDYLDDVEGTRKAE